MTPVAHITAGSQYSFWGQLDTLGFFAGKSGSVANGSTEGMGRFLGITSANPTVVEPENVNIPGDDTTVGSIDFPPNEVPSWITELSVLDLQNQAYLQTTSIESIAGGYLGVLQPNTPVYPDVCIIYQGKTRSQDVASRGLKAWSGVLVPVASAVPLGRGSYEHRAAATDRFKMTAQVAGKKPWGVTITDGLNGTDGAPLMPFTFDYPVTMQRITGNGSTATFALDFAPVGVTSAAVHKDTQPLVATTDYTMSTANKTITFIATPAAATKIVVFYQFAGG